LELWCKKCGSTSFIKNGFVCGRQPYRCQTWGFNFTDTPSGAAQKLPRHWVFCSTASGKLVFGGWGNRLRSPQEALTSRSPKPPRRCPSRKSRKKSVRWNWVNCGIFFRQKNRCWIWKTYAREARRWVALIVVPLNDSGNASLGPDASITR